MSGGRTRIGAATAIGLARASMRFAEGRALASVLTRGCRVRGDQGGRRA